LSPKHVKLLLYLDENFPEQAGKFLKSEGHNVKSTSIQNKGLSDLEQIKLAIKNGRILVSLDKDFKVNDNLLGAIRRGPGIILIASSQLIPEKIIKVIKRNFKKISQSNVRGKVCRISYDKCSFK